jgi:ATP-binding protein involved in chromosome partitioning
MALDRQQVLEVLKLVMEPELNKDIITLNLVRDVQVQGDAVIVELQLPGALAGNQQQIKSQVEQLLVRKGAGRVQVNVAGAARGPGGAQAQAPTNALPQVKHIVAIGAGKGGVGKSTVAANVAVGLQRLGMRVGLMDGDIYGPSMPTMLGIRGQQPKLDGSRIVPHQVHGIHAITIGSLVEQDKPLIWRGPMAHGAFKQLMLDNTQWPELDYLIVDLPPGTGDVPLTLCQLLPLTGAVVVATPQQVALDDAIRAVRMFEQLGSPVLGMIENMSYMPLPGGQIQDLFGRGGAQQAAKSLGLAFLGELPMFPELRINSDEGNPHKNFEYNPQLRAALETIVNNLIAQVQSRSTESKPTLTIT